MRIIFYISSHGFGHMGRNIPLIAALLKHSEVERIYVRCAKAHLTFLKSNIFAGKEKLVCLEEQTDVGHVSCPGTMVLDKKATKEAVEGYMAGWPARIRREAKFLKEQQVDRAVIDIVPWAFWACVKAGTKSVFLSNFTWVDIYQQYFDEGILAPYKACYRQADKALLYALPMPGLARYFRHSRQVSYVCRPFDTARVEQIRKAHSRPMVYVSVGKAVSLRKEIVTQGLPYDFIVTEGVKLVGDNVTVLPKTVSDTHNYIKACDYMISKAGWGSIAEAMLAQKKLALLARPTVAEDCNSIHQLQTQGLCIEVEEEQLQQIGQVVQQLEQMPAPDFSQCQDSQDVICNEILTI